MSIDSISPNNATASPISPRQQITRETADLALKASIVGSAAEAQVGAKNRPLELIYKAAIEKLNEALEPELGPDAIQQAADSGMDFSPEAVAERIVSFATSYFGTYQENHGDLSEEDQLSGFSALIRDAIDQGFSEAREILDGLGVLQGGIKDNAERTYGLIQDKLDAFEQSTRQAFEGQQEESTD